MAKLLIVDDELGQVKEMTEIVRLLRPDFEVSGVVSGAEALEHIRADSELDVVITDIRMPVMDGLELIERILALREGLLLVILSGYGDFQYAKKAIEYGVFEYLVKPVSKGDLLALFEKIDKACLEKQRKRAGEEQLHQQLKHSLPAYVERQFNKWLQGELRGGELDEIAGIFPARGAGAVVVSTLGRLKRPADPPSPGELAARQDGYRARLAEVLGRFGHAAVCALDMRQDASVAIIGADGGAPLDYERLLSSLSELAGEAEAELGMRVTIGVSGEAVNVSAQIETCFKQAMHALDYSFYSAGRQCIPYRAVQFEPSGGQLNLYELESRLTAEISRGNMATISAMLSDTFAPLCGGGMTVKPSQMKEYFVYIVLNIVEKTKVALSHAHRTSLNERFAALIYDCDKCDELRRTMKTIMEEIAAYWSDKETDSNDRLIRQCKAYIDQHYMHDISLDALAGHFHFNPSYLSNVFKTSAGIGYSDYLTKVRIDKAKELLQSSRRKIFEIAAAVGYNNSTYFIKIFKRETGMSPHQYRKLHGIEQEE